MLANDDDKSSTMQHGQHRHRAYQKLSTLQYVGHRNRKLASFNAMWNKDLIHNITVAHV